MGKFRDLIVYQKAFKLAMEIFQLTKNFPSEEKFGLIIQIRKSSRSVCSCLAEGYRKRQYEAHFVAKMSDADMENSETQVWLDFAFESKYIDKETYNDLINKSEEVGKLLNHMVENPGKYKK
ncbi:MAG: four helix bundle protein [Ignavibacteriaceae bacterium]